MKSMHLMVDIDDVLFPLAEGLHAKAQELGLHDGTEPALKVWHGEKQYRCDVDKWYGVFDALHADDYYRVTAPYEGVTEALRIAAWEGHRISLVTARGFMSRADDIRRWTREWVEEWAVPGEVTFAKDKVAAQAVLGRYDAAIDDGIHNYRALKADGVNVALRNRPHNAADEVPAMDRVSGVPDWLALILPADAAVWV